MGVSVDACVRLTVRLSACECMCKVKVKCMCECKCTMRVRLRLSARTGVSACVRLR